MSIRAKTIGIVSTVVLLVIAGSVYISSRVLLPRFDKLEVDRSYTNISRVAQAYDVEVQNLRTKIADWSTWDDTYKYISDKNPEFEESNLQQLTLQNLRIHDMLFTNRNRVITSLSYDDVGDRLLQTSSELLTIATSSAFMDLLSKSGGEASGTIIVDSKPYILVAKPIVKSDGSGPSRGVLIFTRYLSSEYAKEISNTVKLPLTIQVIPPLAVASEHLKEELAKGQEQLVEVESADAIEADYFVKDIFGNPSLYFHLELPRDVHAKGVEAVRYIALITVGVGTVVLILLIIILDRLILRRITTVSREIINVGKVAESPQRLLPDGNSDEISSLITSVNTMLQSIDESQQLLKEERVRMQQYIDSAGVMIVVLDAQGSVALINNRACAVLGRKRGDIVGHDWLTLCVPESEHDSLRGVMRALTEGKEAEVEYKESSVITGSGEIRLIGWHNSVMRNGTGEIESILSSGEDITERRLSERAIEQKNHELESTKKAMLNILEDEKLLEDQVKAERDQANTIISTMSEGLFVVDRDMNVLTVNSAAEQLIGMTQKNMIGRKLMDITTLYKGGEPVPEENRPLWRTLHSGESFQFGLEDDHYFEGAKGKFPVAIATTALKRGNDIIGALITFHDISRDKEIKNTIEQTVVERTRDLEKEQARLTASIRSLSIGFIMTNAEGSIVLVNDSAKSILQGGEELSSIDTIARRLTGVLDIHSLQQACLKDKSVQHISAVQFESRWIRFFMVPVLTQDGKKDVIGTVMLIEDITERKVMERSKDEFFSIASHELRTPLTAIRGNTSMIMDFFADALKDEQLREMICDIHESSIRLIEIVNDFLNVSRLEQGKIEFKKEHIELKSLIVKTIEELEGAAGDKHVRVRLDDTGELPHVLADTDRVKQVLINLVGNSLKFTEAGEIVVRASREDAWICVRVKDTGRGISRDNQLLLFRKFQQAGSSLFTRDTTRGTGLGLYISRLLVEGMGGKIFLEESEEGKGSTFVFTLPVVP